MRRMKKRVVSRADFGSSWPLTVDAGTLMLCPRTQAVRLQVGDRVYALNGMASAHYGDLDIEPLHATNPDIPPALDEVGNYLFRARKPLTPLIRAGQDLGSR